MADLYLLIGGNQGNRPHLIHQTIDLIRQRIGSITALSRLYETAPWGTFAPGETPQNFLNQAILVSTSLSSHQVLVQALDIEKILGRQRPDASPAEDCSAAPIDQPHLYSSRPIDIDIIFYDAVVMDTPDLTIPHPRMHLRRFVLTPLCDIAPDFVHPVLNKTITQLLSECEDTCSCYCCS